MILFGDLVEGGNVLISLDEAKDELDFSVVKETALH